MYLGWYDDNPKKSVQIKIEEAIEAYEDRFGTHPNVVLVNEHEATNVEGVEIQVRPFIRRFNYWVGWREPVQVAA